ncbi:hypothetical protein CAPTEDRAFT_167007 [Capitella teleta]|uniref:Prefoldin subunit 2 n=1 Tax=Capitella teleta TaxID=283909 RepID=R7V8S8_CAPTE|nr:hypothetical protein CAPTEDRAFT_167007 [Capitella teleta]|eukprot:ELU14974.1 hypothetical protein CAPTEDRAFT_167007 [Capitella teleta]
MASQEAKNKSGMSQEQIIQGFNDLRNQQKQLINKISELEMERKEHDLVMETLKDVEPDRKCFRMVGGVLVERSAKEVLPALKTHYESLGKVLETLNTQMVTKGREVNEYKEKHNLRIRGEDAEDQKKTDANTKASSSGVLVAGQAS